MCKVLFIKLDFKSLMHHGSKITNLNLEVDIIMIIVVVYEDVHYLSCELQVQVDIVLAASLGPYFHIFRLILTSRKSL